MSNTETAITIGINNYKVTDSNFYSVPSSRNTPYRLGDELQFVEDDNIKYYNESDYDYMIDLHKSKVVYDNIADCVAYVKNNYKRCVRTPMYVGECGEWIYTLDDHYRCRINGYDNKNKRCEPQLINYTKKVNKVEGYAYFSSLDLCNDYLQKVWKETERMPLIISENGYFIYKNEPFYACSRTGFDDEGLKDTPICITVKDGEFFNRIVDFCYFHNLDSCVNYLEKVWVSGNEEKSFELNKKYGYNDLIKGAYEKISLGLLDDAIKILIHAQFKMKEKQAP